MANGSIHWLFNLIGMGGMSGADIATAASDAGYDASAVPDILSALTDGGYLLFDGSVYRLNLQAAGNSTELMALCATIAVGV